MNDALTSFMDSFRLGARLEELTSLGAVVATCHTTEYARGTEGCAYLDGVERGNVGSSLTKFLINSDVAFTLAENRAVVENMFRKKTALSGPDPGRRSRSDREPGQNSVFGPVVRQKYGTYF